MPLPEKQLRARDAKRDLGAELLASAREMKAGQGAVLGRFPTSTKKTCDAKTKPTPRVIVFVIASLGSSLLLMYPSASGQ